MRGARRHPGALGAPSRRASGAGALEFSGGAKKLARERRVPLADLEKWMAGTAVPPLAVFLKAIDLVLDETQPPAGRSEPADPESPRDCASGSSSLIL
jgi:hypothetical protein